MTPISVIGSSSNTTFENGTITARKRIQLAFAVTAHAPGTWEIPSFIVIADDRQFQVPRLQVTFKNSADTSLLSAQITGSTPTVYLGDAIDLDLMIKVKRFVDPTWGLELSAGDTWNRLASQSRFGPFTDAAARAGREADAVRVSSIEQQDEAGEMARFYVFSLSATTWPDRIGPVDLSSVSLIMDYPVRMVRQRGLLGGSRPHVTESQLVTAHAVVDSTTVEPLPTSGKPAWFTGAVGTYTFSVIAEPTEVTVGEPITLTMTVTATGPTQPSMDLLQAPDLSAVGALNADFKVPAEQMGGVVTGRAKTFTQTIRATRDTIDRIPPLPMTSFDTQSGRYVTVSSEAIPIDVLESKTISASDIGGVMTSEPTGLTEVTGGLLANYTNVDELLEGQELTWWWLLLVMLVVPPVLVGSVVAGQHRSRRLRNDVGYARSRAARRRADLALTHAASDGDAHQAHGIVAAITGFIADRCDLPPGTMTSHDVTSTLNAAGITAETVSRVNALLTACETAQFAGDSSSVDDSVLHDARNCLALLQKERLS
jgi:hypothetical protein